MSKAIFEGLVFDEHNHCAPVAYVGADPTYVIIEDGFRYHVDAHTVDEQIITTFRAQVASNEEEIGAGVLRMMGKDDLFSKAAVMSALKNIDSELKRLHETGLPTQAREYLGMMGFRVTINRHGDVVNLDMPSGTADEE
ncbi:MAG: hypothetical protein NTZ50_07055 [Chloroflexi bacterium]|nr:hypothetical protein [Chloroflexota bacterium]